MAAGAQQRWTLDDCMRYAVAHNFDVRSAEISHSNDRSDYRNAVGGFLPSVGASIGLTGNFGRSIDPATNTYDNLRTLSNSYGVSLSWTLFDGGRMINDFKEAKARRSMSEKAIDSSRDDVAITVMDAYVNLQYYGELLKITEAKKEESRLLLQKTRRMKELGMKSAVEVSQAAAQFADDDYTHINTVSNFVKANLALKTAMNYPIADSLALSASVDSIPIGILRGASDIFEFAKLHNPKMQQARLNEQSATYALRSAKGSYAPTISLEAGISDYYYTHAGASNLPFGKQMDVNLGQYVGVSVSIPIFDGFSRASTVGKAKNAQLEARLNYDRKLYELQSGIEQAVADCRSLALETDKMRSKVAADSIAYSLSRRKYEEGLMSFPDLQTSANSWYASQAELLKATLLYAVKLRLVDYYATNELIRDEK